MSTGTLFDKVWDLHTVGILPSGQTQLFIGLHLIHEVTSPQAFSMLRERGLSVLFPDRTVATVDHIIPTDNLARPFADSMAEEMLQELEKNTSANNIRFYPVGSGRQGIVHVIAPEQGFTQPGMTIACGDSHTSTHGAFGAIAFGIGTSQVRDVLASQTLALSKLKVRKIEVNGKLNPGVFAKDVILHIIRKLGVKGGVGYAYEFAGTTFEQMSMEERMTVCNMSIEGGARCGYVNPDQVTYDYLNGRDFAPKGEAWDQAIEWWNSLRSDADAVFDDVVVFDAADIAPTVTWGITPGQGIGISDPVPTPDTMPEDERAIALEAYQYMDLKPGEPLQGTKVDVCFIGSCTNGRISDLREAAKVAQGRQVAAGVKAFVVPGSERVKVQAEKEGLDRIFVEAGFEWREPGCSMCLAMNPDKLEGRQLSASSSNRNFKGRQGSASGRTLLMSPAMVVAAAVTGKVTDVRELM
ncbi:isopropylmalate isomerase large subunit [Leptolyngbya boryana NIES-2135]|jgi:3-isopropylmalate/(R)-2-methylmalate dehydratase large subunit|uniref:3-isopropylmalate dehydratase large subunit n=1 Tax=Leptolyngbya boryana NIES-2135 TaxID=1973484 RepID=A0A1Z4JFK3_LEPBY|nr:MULTISPECIES: 3-isopropylmalate dehydratase large subunit [Leptolyngbya]BAY55542.1 isopropylmalate isomerase large subunit [Leptolyngbya boryana NIES-2135]MBD1854291.1 3-isopropylmalate dehydratase large subunit [Leptolyngbya sp. FACHB-1624]MBD2371447.1 3-isopropylmalate dehydratase large subunit [Leptolyngbya sp. FACHB-161]MBD2377958.1 3-isopropylmalate dehydratase large subunit [Leptolyngbya sp. FACHB-238]MBD2402393.1 3-isopropylmalate dehydratase large subunit [Leptolyngbya sp. FACHB-239